jgi:uncharacterized membrane protein YhaH (DUF805 family)
MLNNEALQNIEKLHQLKKDGVITEDDFEQSKARILHGPAARSTGPSFSFGSTATPEPADHVGWMTLPLKRYTDFTGRSSRKEFWMYQIIPTVIFTFGLMVVGADTNMFGMVGSVGNATIGLLVLAALVFIVPSLAVQVRRFHDQDRSGWFALLNLIPYAGVLIIAVFMLLEGTPGDNRFGAKPVS